MESPTTVDEEGIEAGIMKGTTTSTTTIATTTTDTEVEVTSLPSAMATNSIFQNHQPNDLVWADIDLKVLLGGGKKGRGAVQKQILDKVWGKAEAGTTTAIMGASGAGKTSLFQTLAGRVRSGGKVVVDAEHIYLGGTKIDPLDREIQKQFAYVSQQDALHESSTPRESLTFSARLRLPKATTNGHVESMVNTMIEELGLSSCCDTIIGGSFRKGISGGEKRRVSIGIELVAHPSTLFLDEPTSGLDSYAASQVMRLLDRVAKAGNTVLFTIHQPSSNVFSSFDRLILLNQGRVMHQGSVATIGQDMAAFGYPVPPNYNPADWFLDVSQIHSIGELEDKGFFGKAPAGHLDEVSSNTDDNVPGKSKLKSADNAQKVSVLEEFKYLQQREMRTLYRSPTQMLINVGATSILSVIFGVIFFDVGREDRAQYSAVQSQLGAIVNILISVLMGQSQPALFTFAAERPVFLREYSTNHYNIIPYFLSHLWTEALQSFLAMMAQALVVYWLIGFQMTFWQFFGITYSLALTSTAVSVMLGAFFADARSASGLYALMVVPQFYFSGLFIAAEFIPTWIRWAQYLCSMTYASRIAFAYEFSDCGDDPIAQDNCDALLSTNQVEEDDVWWYWLALMGLFTMFRLGAVYVLHTQAYY